MEERARETLGSLEMDDFYEMLELAGEIIASHNLQGDRQAQVIVALSAGGNVYHKVIRDPFTREEQLSDAKSFTEELVKNQDTQLDKIVCVWAEHLYLDVLPACFRKLIYTADMINSKTKILLKSMKDSKECYIVKEFWQIFPPAVCSATADIQGAKGGV